MFCFYKTLTPLFFYHFILFLIKRTCPRCSSRQTLPSQNSKYLHLLPIIFNIIYRTSYRNLYAHIIYYIFFALSCYGFLCLKKPSIFSFLYLFLLILTYNLLSSLQLQTCPPHALPEILYFFSCVFYNMYLLNYYNTCVFTNAIDLILLLYMSAIFMFLYECFFILIYFYLFTSYFYFIIPFTYLSSLQLQTSCSLFI